MRHQLTIFADPAKPAPPPLTPSEMSRRWPTTVPEHLALPVGQWLDRDYTVKVLQAANGATDSVVAQSWLVAMVQAGLVDIRDGDGCVRLLPEAERPGYATAEARRAHLEALRRDLADLEQA